MKRVPIAVFAALTAGGVAVPLHGLRPLGPVEKRAYAIATRRPYTPFGAAWRLVRWLAGWGA